jgi:hypothetical protein
MNNNSYCDEKNADVHAFHTSMNTFPGDFVFS